MKNLTTTLCMVLLSLLAVTSFAQIKPAVKPAMFSRLPASIRMSKFSLSSFFLASTGENIQLSLDNDIVLSGAVINKFNPYVNLQTIVIKLDAFDNSLLSLSKQTDKLNNITYVGKIINPLSADGFELIRNAEGDYELNKIEIEKIFVSCNQ